MANSEVSAAPVELRKRRDGPRTPSSIRGKARYAALLDATDALLHSEDPEAIGLYQIAERAGVPPASVYHFLPTKEAAFLALVERYLEQLAEFHRTPVEARLLQSWQDLERINFGRTATFLNANTPARKILYGGHGSVETRKIDKLFVQRLATTHYARLDRLFHVPYIAEPEKKYEITLGIFDAIFEISVRRHDLVTEDYLNEACDACIAYQRLFLPEKIERRQALIDAALNGESLVMPDTALASEG